MASVRRIMVVDDDESILEAVREILIVGVPDVQVHTYARPKDALEALAEIDPDLVISDQQMPGMDGLEFLGQVKRRRSTVVRMMLTGAGDLQVAARAINEGGVHRFFMKPVDPDDLIAGVRDGLARRGRGLSNF